MSAQDDTIGLLSGRHTAPFLFIGSGFSLRHLGLEDWKNLLGIFAGQLNRPANYYISKANGDLALAGTLLAEDYNQYWWNEPALAPQREKYQHLVISKSDALKIAIADYIESKIPADLNKVKCASEIEALRSATVDGIITTNWDRLIESVFPEYRPYIGQSQLISASPQGIAEIYKIHGCTSRPSSLILTSEDYNAYNSKNAYLAAKLITIFVEHPVFFIGYSLTDQNIRDLLSSVVGCLDAEGFSKVKENLIFVQREKAGRSLGVSDTQFLFDQKVVPAKVLVTDNFEGVYRALGLVKRKIPTKQLRIIKEQIYEIARDTDPKSKISVVDLESVASDQSVEFVVGVGVATQLGAKGYLGLTSHDLFKILLSKESLKHSPRELVQLTIPLLVKGSHYIPYYRFLREAGISSRKECEEAGLAVNSIWDLKTDDFRYPAYRTQAMKLPSQKVIDIISANYGDKTAALLAWVEWSNTDKEPIRAFLESHIEAFVSKGDYHSTWYRKLACLYDRRYFGYD